MKRGEFTCDGCGGTFESEWTVEEAEAEAEAVFGGVPPEERVEVCDDCYAAIMGHANKAGWTEHDPVEAARAIEGLR